MSASDLGLVLEWRNHPSVRSSMYTQHEIAPNEHASWFERASVDPHCHLLIYEEDGVPNGFVNFTANLAGCNSVWGFYAAPEAPRGAGLRMGRAALAYGFNQARFHKISGEVLVQNKKSIRFHLSLGFQREGILRDHFFYRGQYEDVACLGLLDVEWRRQQEKP